MRLLVERKDGEAFGRVRNYERWTDGTERWVCTVSGPWTDGRERELTLKPEDLADDGEWTLLDGIVDAAQAVNAVQCVRCHRLFFVPGACPSWTCLNLQAEVAG